MKTLTFMGLFGAGFISGGVAVGLWSGYLFSRVTVPKEVDVACQAAQQAEWLAELRLGETTNAIKSMESSMDNGVASISQWASVRPPDEKTRAARDGFLRNVKVYHESYPLSGSDPAGITAFLSAVPRRSPQSTCKSGVCRLDDRRLAALNAKTNAP